MNILILVIWCACLCCARPPPWTQGFRYQGNSSALCQNITTPRHPGWHFFSNSYIKLLDDNNRPWRNPLNHAFLRFPSFPDDVVLPDPLLPTSDIGTLELYQQAVMTLMEDEHASKYEKDHADEMYALDLQCWERIQGCQIITWLGSSPTWSCISDSATTIKDLELDNMTLSLLQRSNRYALINLGHRLVPFIQHVSEGPMLSKRQYQSFRDDNVTIPTSTEHPEVILDHLKDPLHQQQCAEVRKPHFRNNLMPPKPLLSTVDNVFVDTNIAMLTLYRDALLAYDVDCLMSDRDKQRRHKRFDADSWDWVVHDACYYNKPACDMKDSSHNHNWFVGHTEAAQRFKKEMEEQGLVELGRLLLDEVKQSHGTRLELEQLLAHWVHD